MAGLRTLSVSVVKKLAVAAGLSGTVSESGSWVKEKLARAEWRDRCLEKNLTQAKGC